MNYSVTYTTRSERNRLVRILLSPWTMCLVGAMFYTYEYFLRIAPSVMTSGLTHSFAIDATQLGNLAAFYYYAYSPMQIPVGVLLDRYGPRRLLTLACLACVLGTFLFASSNYLGFAQLGRFLMGFGSAFAYVGVLKLATLWLPPERFAMISGLTAALGTVGAMVGDMTMTALVDRLGWRNTLFISVVLGVILTIVLWRVIRDKPSGKVKPAAGQAVDTEDGEPAVDCEHRISFNYVLSGLWNIIKKPQMWVIGFIGCLLYLPSSAFAELWGIPYLESAHGYGTVAASIAVSMLFFGFTLGGPLMGYLSDKFSSRRLPMTFGAIFAAVFVSIIVYMPHLSHLSINILLFLFGVSYGAQVIVFAVGRESSPERLSGTAIALTNMFVMLGGMLFQPMIGYLLDFHWQGHLVHGLRVYSVADYQFALASLPISLLVAAVLTFFIRETGCKVKLV